MKPKLRHFTSKNKQGGRHGTDGAIWCDGRRMLAWMLTTSKTTHFELSRALEIQSRPNISFCKFRTLTILFHIIAGYTLKVGVTDPHG